MTATDKNIPRVTISDECIAAYNQLRSGRGIPKPKFIIYKVSDDTTTIVLEESSPETDYEVFLQKLSSAVDKDGNPAPRYAVYDVEYDLGSEGKRYEQFMIS
jgi:cofilin